MGALPRERRDLSRVQNAFGEAHLVRGGSHDPQSKSSEKMKSGYWDFWRNGTENLVKRLLVAKMDSQNIGSQIDMVFVLLGRMV